MTFLAGGGAALLADEMGLGKTVQAGVALMAALQTEGAGRGLIVVPASLRLNWERELRKWAPGLPLRRVQGTREDRDATYQLPIRALITSYEQVRSDINGPLGQVEFDLVVLDEAQRIKNINSTTALACRLLRKKRGWALTGTPVENWPADLVSIFQFLSPGLLNLAMPRSELQGAMQPHFLRRTKKDALPELPPMIDQTLPLEMKGQQRIAYDDLWLSRRDHVRGKSTEVNLLALITRLKQLCNFDPISEESVKWQSLALILESLTEVDDKVIVVSQYVETLRWLSERMATFPHDLYHGQLSEVARDEVLGRFETEPGPRALLLSLRAGGVGLNLNAASVVVLFDRWWNPAVESQAIQRAHRFGRQRPLHVFRFLVEDSVEERIEEILREKQELFAELIDSAANAAMPSSRTDLLRILGLSREELTEELAAKREGGPDGPGE